MITVQDCWVLQWRSRWN